MLGGGSRSDGSPRNHANESRNLLLKKFNAMEGVQFVCGDYRKIEIKKQSVIYADPPYDETLKYKTKAFDHNAFRDWCDAMAKQKHSVYVSEMSIPDRDNWEVVWEITRANNIGAGDKRSDRWECLMKVT